MLWVCIKKKANGGSDHHVPSPHPSYKSAYKNTTRLVFVLVQHAVLLFCQNIEHHSSHQVVVVSSNTRLRNKFSSTVDE